MDCENAVVQVKQVLALVEHLLQAGYSIEVLEKCKVCEMLD